MSRLAALAFLLRVEEPAQRFMRRDSSLIAALQNLLSTTTRVGNDQRKAINNRDGNIPNS